MVDRLGIYGGTFDPIHVGHLVAAVNVGYALDLDRVLLVVANEPWQKVGSRSISSARHRLAVVEAAVADLAGIEASGIEIDRGGPSYTIDTVRVLAAAHPGAELFLVVGTDVADDLDTWEQGPELASIVTLVVVNRPSAARIDPAALPLWRIVEVEMPGLDISSTDLRERIVDGRPLDFLIPEAAVRVLRSLRLYDRPG